MPDLETDEPSAVHDLGLGILPVDDELHGTAAIQPTMWTPGTEHLRVSVAATWADALLGLHAVRVMTPRLPVTLDLDVHLFDEIAGVEQVHGRSRLVGFGSGTFMAAPDPSLTMESMDWVLDRFATPMGSLAVPLAERIGCERTEPGVAVQPCTPVVHNASKAINGGLLVLAIEEAALSADPAATRIESVQVRYLRAIRVGPAIARAELHHGMGRVEVRDASTDAIAAIATTRSC